MASIPHDPTHRTIPATTTMIIIRLVLRAFDDDQSPGHRLDVPVVQLRDVHFRRHHGAADPCRAVPARLQVVRPELFNQLTTLHGIVMIFSAIMPAFVGFANWMLPLQLGAPDMAFARMNNWSFWLLPPAILLIGSFFVPGGAAAGGWTLYPPLSCRQGMGMDMMIFAVHIMGASSIMGSINIITTILNMRTPWHDDDEDADVCMDLADHGLSADRDHACSCWCGDHAADRPPFRHHLLQRCWWR